MAIVTYIFTDGIKPTPEQRAEIREAMKCPYTYDPDCPLLTEEQLTQFRMTWEERVVRMEEAYQNDTLEHPRSENFEEKPVEEAVISL